MHLLARAHVINVKRKAPCRTRQLRALWIEGEALTVIARHGPAEFTTTRQHVVDMHLVIQCRHSQQQAVGREADTGYIMGKSQFVRAIAAHLTTPPLITQS